MHSARGLLGWFDPGVGGAKLHFSEAEAYLRIAVARASRSFPALLAMLGDGRLHLSGIARLAPHLDADNVEAVTARAAHMSKREIDKLVSELSPRPDVPTRMRKLPARMHATCSSAQLRPDGVDAGELVQVAKEESSQLAAPAPVTAPMTAPMPQAEARRAMLELRGCGARSNSGSGGANLEPIAPARYKVEFTASAELRDKLRLCPAPGRSGRDVAADSEPDSDSDSEPERDPDSDSDSDSDCRPGPDPDPGPGPALRA